MPLLDALDRRLNQPAFPWLLALIFALVRLPLLTWYHGEYTDSVLLLSLLENHNTYYPPLFTLCAWIPRALGMDPTLAGRLVSIAATGLCTVPLFHLGKRLAHAPAGLLAVLLYQTAALTNQWAPRAMSDALFTLLFAVAVYYVLACFSSPSGKRDFPSLLFWAGLASLCRYQGLAFLPVLVALVWRRQNSRLAAADLWALLPWLALVGWIAWRGFGHAGQYLGRTANLADTLAAYGSMTWGFVRWLPYAMGYLNVAFALAGLYFLRRAQRPFVLLVAYLVVVWFAAHVPFQSFQFRYFLPLMPVLCALAAVAWWVFLERLPVRGRALAGAALGGWLLYSCGFSGLVLTSQRDAWGDLWQAARYLRTLPPGTRIFADEVYGTEVKNYKLAFWSGREIKPLYSSVRDLRASDVVVVSSIHDDLPYVMKGLGDRWNTDDPRTFTATLTPRLGDLIAQPSSATSNPQAMAFRNIPQRFTTVVVRLR